MHQKILRIESSVRLEKSASRQGTQQVMEALLKRYPGAEVLHRELGRGALFQMTEGWQEGCYVPEKDRTFEQRLGLADSDILIEELLAADFIVIGAPMHNFTIAASLKAYIDQVCRINKTFAGGEGLVKNKKVYVVMSRGGGNYEEGGSNAAINFQEPYLRHILGFMGMKDVQFFPMNFTSRGAVPPLEITL